MILKFRIFSCGILLRGYFFFLSEEKGCHRNVHPSLRYHSQGEGEFLLLYFDQNFLLLFPTPDNFILNYTVTVGRKLFVLRKTINICDL